MPLVCKYYNLAFDQFKQAHVNHNFYIISSNLRTYGLRLCLVFKWPQNIVTINIHKVHASPITNELHATECTFIINYHSHDWVQAR